MVISSSGWSTLKNFIREKIFFGNEPTGELLAILSIYFVEGILGLARLAVSFFLKDELGLTPAQVSALVGIIVLPWMVKPLLGLISDGLPIFGYRRRPYLVLSGILGASAWMSLATVVHTPVGATIAIALSSLSVAISDVIVDSIIVEKARGESQAQAGSLQSLSRMTTSFGGLLTAYFSGLLLEHFTTRTVFAITALFPLIVSAVAWVIVESPVNKVVADNKDSDNLTVKDQLQQLRNVVTQKTIWLPTAFLFIFQATPSADSAFFFFTTNELHFQPEFLGRVHFVTSIAALVGIWIFQRFLKNLPFRVIFGWSTVLSAVLGMTMLLLVTHTNRMVGIDDQWFTMSDSLILSVMGKIAYMPVLVLAARLCPPGVEATFFALLMSVTNLGGLLSHEIGAVLTYLLGITETNFDSLWLLVIITNLTRLLPLPFLHWLPEANSQTQLSTSQLSSPENTKQPLVPDLTA